MEKYEMEVRKAEDGSVCCRVHNDRETGGAAVWSRKQFVY